MKKILLLCFITVTITLFSCINIFHRTIDGNGNFKSEERNITAANNIKSYGDFDIEITQGSSAFLKIEADENLLPYIVTEDNNGTLEIRTKDNVNISSNNKIKIYITTAKLEDAEIIGSGNITASNTITSDGQINLDITGSGNITLAVNSAEVKSSITGAGNINLSGEAKNSQINIEGLGNYKAESLSSSNVAIEIDGSGDARVSAVDSLTIDIGGSGNVYYHGKPTIHQSIGGIGSIKQLQ